MNRQYPINTRLDAAPYLGGQADYADKISDPKQAFRAFRRRLPLFFATLIATFLAVAVFTLQSVPIYIGTSSIIIDARDNNVVDLGAVLSGLPPDSAVVDTEVEIIRSRSLAAKVVAELELEKIPEFNPMLREPGLMAKAKKSVKNLISFVKPKREVDEAALQIARAQIQKEAVVSMLLSKTAAHRMGTTYGITISAYSEDPSLAAAIANMIAEKYLVEQLDAKFDATRRANLWLEDRLSDLKEEVKTDENLVEAYRSESGLFSAGNTTISQQQMGELTAQLIVQRAELAEAEARLASVRDLSDRGLSAEVSGEALRSPVIADLRRQQAEINRERADLQTRYGPLHPEIERIYTEIANINDQIKVEVRRIVSNLEGEVTIVRQRVRSLESSLGRTRATLSQNNRAGVRLRELERNADASRAIYESFLARFKQTNEQEGLAEADARILSSAAIPPNPAFPKTSLNLVIGFVLGLMLGALAVIISEALNSQISSGEDIEESFKVPFLGNFPRLSGSAKKKPGEYLVSNPMSNYAESFRNLRASIMFADLDSTVQTVAITSSQPDEGKTTLTYGLGRMSAMSGTNTLIIDGDFRRKELSSMALDKPAERGFLECLFGECEIEDAITVDEKTGLHILPLTSGRQTPRDVFGSKVFDQLMADLKGRYEFIIIDTGPLLLLAETRVLTSKVDQVVVVARWLKTNRAVLKQTMSILNEFRANIAGIVINQVDVNKYHRQGYGHSGYEAYAKYYNKT